MNNIHNFNKFSSRPSVADHSRLLLILAVAVALIGGELVWAEMEATNFDIDNYAATISSFRPNRDVVEARNLEAETNLVEVGDDLEGEMMKIDAKINML